MERREWIILCFTICCLETRVGQVVSSLTHQWCFGPKFSLLVSFRPFCPPWDFGQITIILAYMPVLNTERLVRVTVTLPLSLSLCRSTCFYSSGFHTCELSELFSDPPAICGLSHTLELCFGNIPDAWDKAVCRPPPLGRSDHNVIHLLLKYKALVKPVTKAEQVWSDECKEGLRDRLEDTVWDVFFKSYIDAHEITDAISSYIKFCEDNVCTTKITSLWNQKNWKDILKIKIVD